MDISIEKYGNLIADYTKKIIASASGKHDDISEYEKGIGVNNPGFQNWNLLSLNMFEWLKSL